MFSYRSTLFLFGFLAAAAHGTALPEPDALLHGNVIVQDGAYRTVLNSSEYRFEMEVNGEVRSAFAPANDSGRYFVRFPNQVFATDSSTPTTLDSTRFFVVHLATETRVECFETAGSPIMFPSHRAPVVEQDLVFSLGAGSLPDSDADGLPDGWETAYQTESGDGLDTTTQDAHLDFDQDGTTNLEEYLAGTDPTDATDNFEIVMMYDSTAKEPCLEFTGFRDRTYQIQAFANGSTGEWKDVKLVQPGTDGTQIVPYSNVASEDDVCFYRAVIGQ